MKQLRLFKQTTLITIGLFVCLIGLVLSRLINIANPLWVLLSVCMCLLCWRRKNIVTLISVVVFGLSLGLCRGSDFVRQLQVYRELTGKSVVFEAKVQSDAIYSTKGQLSFDVSNIRFIEPKSLSVPGKISVKGRGENAVYRGDNILIRGTLQPTIGSKQARVSFSSFELLNHNDSIIEQTRRNFVAGVATALPEPSASFGLGLLIGYRTSLLEITNEQLAITGLTHIIAVSGYNLTIIVRAIRRGLGKRSKYQQIITCIVLIIMFLLITDFSASIVRASIVSIFSLLAWYYGRQFKPLLLIVLTAAITAIWNPLYIWSDIGWYLSFLAFFGILVIAPLLARMINKSRKEPSQITLLLIETSSAQLMTAPLVLLIFSRVSLVAIVSNLVIAPLVPLAMICTLFAGLSGMFLPVLSGFIAWPARMVLRYMLEMVQVFASVPHAMVERSASWPFVITIYGLLVVFITFGWYGVRQKYGTITDKNTIV